MTNEKYYTVEQVSELLHIHPKTIQRYIREGRLRAVKIGKSWRISGHDLSLFTENNPQMPEADNPRSVTVSSVIDIDIRSKDEAISFVNLLSGAFGSKSPDDENASLHTQYIESEQKLRVMLYGTLKFTQIMLGGIAALTGDEPL